MINERWYLVRLIEIMLISVLAACMIHPLFIVLAWIMLGISIFQTVRAE